MAVSIKNLDAALGAQIGGIDLAERLTGADLEAIEEAWQTRLVIVARGQRLSDPQLLAFSRQFGELDPPGPIRMASRLIRSFRKSTSFPTSSRMASRSAISAPAKLYGMPT